MVPKVLETFSSTDGKDDEKLLDFREIYKKEVPSS